MIKLVSKTAVLVALGTSGMASPEISLRPAARPVTQGPVVLASVEAQRPTARPAVVSQTQATPVAANPGFDAWTRGFRTRARSQGISDRTLKRAFKGISYDADVIRRDRNQSEFTKTIWEYLDSAASDTRIKNGKSALREHRRTLERIEAHYGVPKEVVAAVWGLESAYGSYKGDNDVIQSLATLAYDGRRGRFFESQLIAALKILQAGDVAPRKMTGSWAGAMGHTQFIPTSYLAYAVDFTGDGKRDIWSDDPTDALASTAAYLAKFGWVKGQPWGVEVQLPRNFNFALASRKIQKSPADWAKLGVKGLDGRSVPNYGSASILLPAGGQGAAFMIFKNFAVIERYNTADAYVIGVGHLSDRLKGAGPIQAKWPRSDRALTFKERKEMQRRLTRAGFSTQGVDGKIGPNTIAAVRAYQASQGLTQDGYPSLSLLKSLR
ncbi:lytic murein transglycosylase [Epibacterium sp. SM1979]|uniref:Lytic murein transglycosylase n=1 Tax=Tritonibacter litoralis TaxID=2662264 RepID=A0A843YBW5_9RHOB|nr:lytic murein transglycosylase [Tritonibacter litoralis]MQQ08496.1 lytic murein transglycosylase [Tritonibacter litoralis]